MQVPRGAFHRHFDRRQAAKRGRDGRGFEIPHIGVGDQDEIRRQRFALVGQEFGQRGAAAFLLAFQQNRQPDGQFAVDGQMGAAGLEEADHLAFIVHRTARDDALAARAVDQLRVERVGMPEGQRVGGLHVVMAVEQHMRGFRAGARGSAR